MFMLLLYKKRKEGHTDTRPADFLLVLTLSPFLFCVRRQPRPHARPTRLPITSCVEQERQAEQHALVGTPTQVSVKQDKWIVVTPLCSVNDLSAIFH